MRPRPDLRRSLTYKHLQTNSQAAKLRSNHDYFWSRIYFPKPKLRLIIILTDAEMCYSAAGMNKLHPSGNVTPAGRFLTPPVDLRGSKSFVWEAFPRASLALCMQRNWHSFRFG
jgi:hypothetical protein